ncbi:MAG: glycosyltransferase family A protein [Bacteroidota bacterium]
MNLEIGDAEIIFEKTGSIAKSDVAVNISLFNYEDYIIKCLQSVYNQNEKNIDLVVVDDCSTDTALMKVKQWMSENSERFNNLLLIHHINNRGLSVTRNTAIFYSKSPYIYVLDADNELYPSCISKLKVALDENKDAFFAYNIICVESEISHRLMGYQTWDKELLSKGNYIDAMSLIRREKLIELGGYSSEMKTGWEDYDLWCRVAENDGFGVLVPQILSLYREHGDSMLRVLTHVTEEKTNLLIKKIVSRHNWLLLNTAKNSINE